MASIVVAAEPGDFRFYPLGKRTTVLGRDEAVPIQLLDERVSRKHCQIRFEAADESYFLLDMKSTHGTYVNGRKIQTEVALAEGDVIRVGEATLHFTLQDFPDQQSALAHWKKVGQRGKTTLQQ